MHVAGLFCYPVKSCAGIRLADATLTATGIQHDRSFVVVRPDGTFLTQRELPALAVVATAIAAGRLTLSVPRGGSWSVDLSTTAGDPRRIEVWGDDVTALDQGEEIAALLTAHVGRPVRLARLEQTRTVQEPCAPAGTQVGFVDAYPLLVTTESSLAELNRRMSAPLPMERFRPNIVVAGSPAFAEDSWRLLRVGSVELELVKPCARCAITTVDQTSGERDGAEPLRTLRTFRRGSEGVEFGWNAVHGSTGRLRVGDRVTVLTTRSVV